MTEENPGEVQLLKAPSLSAKSVLQDAILPSLSEDVQGVLNQHLFDPKATGIHFDDALVSLQLVLAKIDAKGLQPRHMLWPSLAASIALLADTSPAGLKARARCGWSHREMFWALEMDMYGYNCGKVTARRFARCLPCAVGKPGKCGGASAAWFCRRRLTTRDTRDLAAAEKKAVLRAERTTLLPSRSDGHLLARGLDASGNPAGQSRKSNMPPPGPEEDERVSAFDRGTWSCERLEGGDDDKSETFVAQARILLDTIRDMPVLDMWSEVNVATTKRYVGCLKRLAGKDSVKRKRMADGMPAMTEEQLQKTELKRWADYNFLLGENEPADNQNQEIDLIKVLPYITECCLPEGLRERSACFLNQHTRGWASEMQPLECCMPHWHLRAGSPAAEESGSPRKRARSSSRSPSVPGVDTRSMGSLTGAAVACTQQLAVAPLDLHASSAPSLLGVSMPATPDMSAASFLPAAAASHSLPPLDLALGRAAAAAADRSGSSLFRWPSPVPQAQASQLGTRAVGVAQTEGRSASNAPSSEPDSPPTPAHQPGNCADSAAAALLAPQPAAHNPLGSSLLDGASGFGFCLGANDGSSGGRSAAARSAFGGKAPRTRSGSLGGSRVNSLSNFNGLGSASLDGGDASIAHLPAMGQPAASRFPGAASSSGAGPSGAGRCDFDGAPSDFPGFGGSASSSWFAGAAPSSHHGPTDPTPADDNAIFGGYLDDFDNMDMEFNFDMWFPPSPTGNSRAASSDGAGPSSSGWGAATMGAPPQQAAGNAQALQTCLLDDASMNAKLRRSSWGTGAAACASADMAAGSSLMAQFDAPPPRRQAASAAAATAHAGFSAPGHREGDLSCGMCFDKEESCPECQRFLDELLRSDSPAPLPSFREPAFAA